MGGTGFFHHYESVTPSHIYITRHLKFWGTVYSFLNREQVELSPFPPPVLGQLHTQRLECLPTHYFNNWHAKSIDGHRQFVDLCRSSDFPIPAWVYDVSIDRPAPEALRALIQRLQRFIAARQRLGL